MLFFMVCRFIETSLSIRQEDDRDFVRFKCIQILAEIVRRCIAREENRKYRLSKYKKQWQTKNIHNCCIEQNIKTNLEQFQNWCVRRIHTG